LIRTSRCAEFRRLATFSWSTCSLRFYCIWKLWTMVACSFCASVNSSLSTSTSVAIFFIKFPNWTRFGRLWSW
jgi:hypothetical protein